MTETDSNIRYTSIPWNTKIDFEVKKKAFKLGAWDFFNNTNFKEKPSIETIKEFASLLEPYYGRLTKYHMWYCNVINSWRIILGN